MFLTPSLGDVARSSAPCRHDRGGKYTILMSIGDEAKMTQRDMIQLASRRLLRRGEDEEDTALRFFVEIVLGIERGKSYTEYQIMQLVARYLSAEEPSHS